MLSSWYSPLTPPFNSASLWLSYLKTKTELNINGKILKDVIYILTKYWLILLVFSPTLYGEKHFVCVCVLYVAENNRHYRINYCWFTIKAGNIYRKNGYKFTLTGKQLHTLQSIHFEMYIYKILLILVLLICLPFSAQSWCIQH